MSPFYGDERSGGVGENNLIKYTGVKKGLCNFEAEK